MMKSYGATRPVPSGDRNNNVVSAVNSLLMKYLASIVLLGRGPHVSTKPTVITRNDLLRAAEISEARQSSERRRRSRRSAAR